MRKRIRMSRGMLALSIMVTAGAASWVWYSTRPGPPITLVVWQTETDKDAVNELKKTIQAFEADHPGVQVQLESIAWNSLLDKLEGALAGHSEPDVTHLEPFMAYSLVNRNLLLPIDNVIETIEKQNGDEIFESVRDLWLYDGRRYGVAHAIGITGFAYRKDWAEHLNLDVPTTWEEYIAFVRAMSEGTNGKLKTLLPGGDRFFIDQLFAELVANNGGKLFDPATNRPLLDEKPVRETLKFFKDLAPFVDQGWATQKYLDQFHRFGRGEAGNVPVTYARATKAISTAFTKEGPLNESAEADPAHFAWMAQPVGPSHQGAAIATIDCEPFVILKSAQSRPAGTYGTNADLAKQFLTYFYKKDRYLKFVQQVPIHLTPVFKGIASSPEYTESSGIWKPWAEQAETFLGNPDRVRPILMPDVTQAGRRLPFLLELHKERILTQAVTDVMMNDLAPEEAADAAQKRAVKLVQRLGQEYRSQ